MNKDLLIHAGEVLLKAKADVSLLLSGTEFSAPVLLIGNQLDQLVSRLHHLGGAVPVVRTSEEFPPITNFMGEDISRPEVKTADIIPTNLEKQIFLDKVGALYENFPQMHTDAILSSYTIPEDVLVLRRVAKEAGVEDYRTKELTVAFIEEIKAAITTKAEQAAEQQKFNDDLKTGKGTKGANFKV